MNVPFDFARLGNISSKCAMIMFFLIIFAVPALDVLLPMVGVLPTGRRYVSSNIQVSPRELFNGVVGVKLENYFRSRSFLVHESGAAYNEFVFDVFGRSPLVASPKDSWLFLRSNLVEIEAEVVSKIVEENRELVRGFREQLANEGITLYLVLIPNRSRVFEEFAYSSKRIPQNRKAFLPLSEASFEEVGVPTLNLTESFKEHLQDGVFFAEDHHWTPLGAQLAAAETAKWLEGLEGDEIGSFEPYLNEIQIVDGSPSRSLVNLLKFRKNSIAEKKFLRPQRVVRFETNWARLRDHISDSDANAVLLETSFGMFGFGQYLQMNLGSRFDVVVEPGNGTLFVASDFLAEKEFIEKRKKNQYRYLVWEIPEYHLLGGLNNENGIRVTLPSLFSEEVENNLMAVEQFIFNGAAISGQNWITSSSTVSMKISNPKSFSRLRLCMTITGGAKRGIVSLGKKAQLALVNTKTPVLYDFQLEQASNEAEIQFTFRNPGYQIEGLEVFAY